LGIYFIIMRVFFISLDYVTLHDSDCSHVVSVCANL